MWNRIIIIFLIIQGISFANSQYFYGELSCSCGKNKMNNIFLNELHKLQTKLDQKFYINSGYRCDYHNKQVGGTTNSCHLSGLAVDISIRGWSNRQIIKLKQSVKESNYFTQFIEYYDSSHIHIGYMKDKNFYANKIYKNNNNYVNHNRTNNAGNIIIGFLVTVGVIAIL